MHIVFDCDLAVKLHVKDVEVGTSSNGYPRQGKVTMWKVQSPHLLKNKVSDLLGLGVMHQ